MNDHPDNLNYGQILAAILEEKHGIPYPQTAYLLEIISAPPCLTAFQRVSSNLEPVLPWLHRIEPQLWPQDKISALQTVINACKTLKPHDIEEIPRFSLFKKGVRGPLSGLIDAFPLYSALWYLPPSGYKSTSHHLLAHFINASIVFRDLPKENETYEPRKKGGSRLIRQLSSMPALQLFLTHLPHEPLSMDQFQAEVEEKLSNDGLSTTHTKLLNSVKLMLGVGIKRGRGSGGGSRLYAAMVTEILPDPDDETGLSANKLIDHSNLNEAQADLFYHQGCSRDELYNGSKMIAEKGFLQTEKGASTTTQAIRTRNRNRAISTANQLLPQRWERLNLHDVVSLFHAVRDLSKGKLTKLDMDQAQRTELAALVSVMYWTSSSLERIWDARLSKSLATLPKVIPDGRLFFCIEENVWIVGQPHLEQRRQADITWTSILRPVNNFIVLPCDPRTLPYLRAWIHQQFSGWIQQKNADAKQNTRKLFKHHQNIHETWLRNFLSLIKGNDHTRLTIHRISIHLFYLLADRTGDVGDASIITGRSPPRGQITSLYYYAPLSQRLQDIYRTTCTDLINTIFPTLHNSSVQPESSSQSDEAPIGSQICPTESTVKSMVYDLKAMLENRRANYRSISYHIEFHNYYTAYCVMMLGYATGYRAVRDPFYSESDIDWETGFAVICDKDSDDYYNSRLVWIPPICFEQLVSYRQHRKEMAEKLILINPGLSKQLSDPWKSQTISFTKKDTSELAPFFFFLRENGSHYGVQPDTLQEHVEWSYTLPLNANRHFLRTYLREQGVHGEVVDAYMGHWDTGQEPFGCYSTLTPQAYRDALAEPLQKLLHQHGWQVKTGIR